MISVKKSSSERFVLKSDDPHWWANITISSDGFLDIQSDYGSYSYCWGSFGDDFKSFLSGCNNDYLLRKFGKGSNTFNPEKTLEGIKREILTARRDTQISADIARSLWYDTKDLDDFTTVEGFGAQLAGSDICEIIYGGDMSSVDFVQDDDPAACAFLEKVWPHFIAEISK